MSITGWNRARGAALAQSAKAALAAVLAWVAAAWVFRLPQPFLAPWAAVFIVEATVYRSVRSACQQVGAVAVAVLLAAAVAWLVPWQLVGIAVAVLVGLLLGRWRGFGDSGPWIGITALLLLTWGTAVQEPLLVDRLVETALGAAIGLAVNGLVFPPVYGDGAREATRRLADELADLLAEMAGALRHGEQPDRADAWVDRSAGVSDLVAQAERAIGLSQESRRLNPRRRKVRHRAAENGHQLALLTLRATWPYVQAVARVLQTTSDTDLFPDTAPRAAFATALDGLSELARLRGDGRQDGPEFDAAVAATSRALDDLGDQLEHPGRVRSVVGLAGMLMPARHALRELTPYSAQ